MAQDGSSKTSEQVKDRAGSRIQLDLTIMSAVCFSTLSLCS